MTGNFIMDELGWQHLNPLINFNITISGKRPPNGRQYEVPIVNVKYYCLKKNLSQISLLDLPINCKEAQGIEKDV